jgi:hypothetical protein
MLLLIIFVLLDARFTATHLVTTSESALAANANYSTDRRSNEGICSPYGNSTRNLPGPSSKMMINEVYSTFLGGDQFAESTWS